MAEARDKLVYMVRACLRGGASLTGCPPAYGVSYSVSKRAWLCFSLKFQASMPYLVYIYQPEKCTRQMYATS